MGRSGVVWDGRGMSAVTLGEPAAGELNRIRFSEKML